MRRESRAGLNFEYVKANPNPDIEFEQQPGKVLMSECNKMSMQQNNMNEFDDVHSAQHAGPHTPKLNDKLIDKSTLTLIREIDAKKCETEEAQDKFPEKWEWINAEARRCFTSSTGARTLKCTRGYSHHGVCNSQINQGLISNRCPRWNCREN